MVNKWLTPSSVFLARAFRNRQPDHFFVPNPYERLCGHGPTPIGAATWLADYRESPEWQGEATLEWLKRSF